MSDDLISRKAVIEENVDHERFGIIEEYFRPEYLGMGNVDRWKPLGLPANVGESVLEEIEKLIYKRK